MTKTDWIWLIQPKHHVTWEFWRNNVVVQICFTAHVYLQTQLLLIVFILTFSGSRTVWRSVVRRRSMKKSWCNPWMNGDQPRHWNLRKWMRKSNWLISKQGYVRDLGCSVSCLSCYFWPLTVDFSSIRLGNSNPLTIQTPCFWRVFLFQVARTSQYLKKDNMKLRISA